MEIIGQVTQARTEYDARLRFKIGLAADKGNGFLNLFEKRHFNAWVRELQSSGDLRVNNQQKPRSGEMFVKKKEPRHYCPGSMKTPKTLLTNLMKTLFVGLNRLEFASRSV